MARRPIRISVSNKDRRLIDELLSSSVQPVRVLLRALALLHLAEGATATATAFGEETDAEGCTIDCAPVSGGRTGYSNFANARGR
jgi:hypothetical protein